MVDDTRTHVHKNDTVAIFHHETLAPISKEKGGSGKTRFRIEPTIYITGVGWEQLDITNSETKFAVGSLRYTRMIETLYNYEHLGNSADQMKQVLENLWNKKKRIGILTDTNPNFNAERYNGGKNMVDLVESDYIWGTGEVLTYGAKKYAPNNWKKGMPESDIIGSLMRHLLKFRQGELLDPESGLDHRFHISCNNMIWTGLYPLETIDNKIQKITKFIEGVNIETK